MHLITGEKQMSTKFWKTVFLGQPAADVRCPHVRAYHPKPTIILPDRQQLNRVYDMAGLNLAPNSVMTFNPGLIL